MVKLALISALVFGSATAQARLVEIVCKPNPNATVSQFAASASFYVDDADRVGGTVQYATRSSQTAQTSDLRSVEVKGGIKLIEAGEITNYSIESFQVNDKSGVRMILNPGLEGPHASTLIIDGKYRYSSECRLVAKSEETLKHHD